MPPSPSAERREKGTEQMPAETTATFAGIHNENEFYSQHYLSEIFTGDIRDTITRWREAAEAAGRFECGGADPQRGPPGPWRATTSSSGWKVLDGAAESLAETIAAILVA